MKAPSKPSKTTKFCQLSGWGLLLSLLVLAGHRQAVAQSRPTRATVGEKTQWHTGKEFRSGLQSPVSFTWEDQPFREGLMNLAQSQRTAIFLDRRVDPSVRVSMSVDDIPLKEAVRQAAKEAQAAIGIVGDVIYVGPPLACARIATICEVRKEEVRELPKAAHRRLLEKRTLDWPELSEPRLLLARAATKYGLTIPNIQAVPHDLWAAGDLPPLNFPEQATLLLAGFDSNFRFHKSARKILLSRFPRAASIERRYRSNNPEKLIKEYQQEFPQAFVRLDEKTNEVIVRSTLEDHQQMRAKTSSTPAPAATSGSQQHTLNVKNQPAGKLLQFLAGKFSIDLQVADDVPQAKLDKLISVSVKQVSSEDLLKTIATQANLRLAVNGNQAMLTD